MERIDRNFAEFVVRQRIASLEQVRECVEIVRNATQAGAATNLPDTMVSKGYLSRRQADELLRQASALEAAVDRGPPAGEPAAAGRSAAGNGVGLRSSSRQNVTALIAGGCVAALLVAATVFLATRTQGPIPPSPTDKAQEAFNEAVAYQEQQPDDPDAAISLLRAVETEYHGTDWARRAAARIDQLYEIRAELQANRTRLALEGELAELEANCEALVRENRFGEALKQVEAFVRKHPAGRGAAEATALQRAIETNAAERYQALVRRADAALATKDYVKARAALEPVQNFRISLLVEKAQKKLSEIESREKNAEQWARWEGMSTDAAALAEAGRFGEAIKLLETAQELPLPDIEELVAQQERSVREGQRIAAARAATEYAAAFDERVKPLLAERSYALAGGAIENLGTRDDVKPAADQLQRGRADVARLAAFWERVQGRAAALNPGQRIRLGGKYVAVLGYDDGIIRYELGPTEAGVGLGKMKGEDILALAGAAAEDEARLQAALFLLYDRDADPVRAYELLAKVERHPDAERYRNLARAAGMHDFEADERAAEAAFNKIEKEAGKLERRLDLLKDFCAKHDHTRCFNERLGDMPVLRDAPRALRHLTPWKSRWYLLARRRATWHDAKRRCEQLGGHLVTITSAAENAFIITELMKPVRGGGRRPVWLGGTNDQNEGNWQWVTGEKWNYSAWLRDEPDALQRQNCAEMTERRGKVGWNNIRAGTPNWFICEWEKQPGQLTIDALRELIALVGPGPRRDRAAEYASRLAKPVSYTRILVPLQYVVVAILNQVDVPYLWDKSAGLIGAELAGRPIDVDVDTVPAAEALKQILGRLKLTCEIDDNGLFLKSGDEGGATGPDSDALQGPGRRAEPEELHN